MFRRQITILLWTGLALFLGFANIAILWSVIGPQFIVQSCTVNGTALQNCELPLFSERVGQYRVDVNVRLSSSVAPSVLRIIPDECLTAVVLNGVPQGMIGDLCDYGQGVAMDVRGKLGPGDNSLTLVVDNRGGRGGVQIALDATDPLAVTRMIVLICWSLITVAGFLWFERKEGVLPHGFILATFMAGCLLRYAYFSVTPHDVRGHDFDGHLEYTQIVAETGLPPEQGWQAYQPPLYYYLAAPWYKAGQWLSGTVVGGANAIQAFSLLLSWLTLGLGAFVSYRLFPSDKEGASRAVFVGFLALLPSLILAAPRINNDALATLVAFVSYALLLLWYRRPSRALWLWLAASLGIGLLAKSTTMLLIVIAVFSLAFHPRFSWKQKAVRLGQMALVGLVVAGWFVVPRALQAKDGRSMVVGNLYKLTNFVKNEPQYLLTFNPAEMLAIPYNNPYDDDARRQYFWEYFYRSALTGEFQFGDSRTFLARSMIASSLALVLLSLVALAGDLRRRARETVPLWGGLLLYLLFAFAYRIAFPYSSSQDFRYVLPMTIPLGYYAAAGLRSSPLGYLRASFLTVFLTAAAAFVASLYVWPA